MLNSAVAAVIKWALNLLTSASVLGLAWCGGHHAGAQSQLAKDAPVIATNHAAAVTAKAEAGLTLQVLNHSAQRATHERAIQQTSTASQIALAQLTDGNALVPADVDATWRAGVVSLRGGASAANDGGSAGCAVLRGPSAPGEGPAACVASGAAH